MDEFIKEPDRMEFVDSDHILNYLESTLEEACNNSLMGCGGNTEDSNTSSDVAGVKLTSTEGLLDSLMKSVCSDSTVINKSENIIPYVIADNSNSSELLQELSKSLHPDDMIDADCHSDSVLKNVTSQEIANVSPLATVDKKKNDAKIKCSEKVALNVWSGSQKGKMDDGEKTKGNDNALTEKDEDEVIIIREQKESGNDDCEIVEETELVSDDAVVKENIKCHKSNFGESCSSTSKETFDHAFHINDNMKKGLSKLAFPSKGSLSKNVVQKKKVPALRPISNTRITIGEALEKAQDAQKSISEKTNTVGVANTCDSPVGGSGETMPLTSKKYMKMKMGSFDPKERRHIMVSIGEQSDVSKTPSPDGSYPGNNLVDGQRVLTPSPAPSPTFSVEDQDEATRGDEAVPGKVVPKNKPFPRCKLSSKMWELLKFTFDHEHFPSSVHMARLAKMMGVTWSQVRNWFTNRRVENKRNCIFPRDKVLEMCPYCKVQLKTEAEQKGHLFATMHIKTVLGMEFVKPKDYEPPRWKQLSQGTPSGSYSDSVNSPVSSNSPSDAHSEIEENIDVVHDKLGKLWKESFLLKDDGIKDRRFCKTSNASGNTTHSYSVENTIKEELKLESDVITSQETSSTFVQTKSEDFQNPLRKMEGIQSEQQARSSTSAEEAILARGPTINRKYMKSSQGAKYPNMKFLEQDQPKRVQVPWDKAKKEVPGTDYIGNMTKSMESSQNIAKNSRLKQKEMQSALEDTLLGYRCPHCFKIFQTEWLMIKHTMSHLMFICDICEKLFPTEQLLQFHLHDHLTGAYEEEKYYCQFSCKVCLSLKCSCYEPNHLSSGKLPQVFNRPQKAKRSKKTFTTKPYSSQNDNLRVTFGAFRRFQQKSVLDREKILRTKRKSLDEKTSTPASTSAHSSLEVESKLSTAAERNIEKQEEISNDKIEQMPSISAPPKLSIRKDLLAEAPSTQEESNHAQNSNSDLVSSVPSGAAQSAAYVVPTKTASKIAKPGIETHRKARGRPVGWRKSSQKDVNMESDFYYMCEICDSSFFSKAEMQEHMFLHRLKSRSRRGEKRSFEEIRGEVRKGKRVRYAMEEDENFAAADVGRFKCPKCKEHFTTAEDLNLHETQVHNGDVDFLEVLKCNYCEKTYRRERDLRRHLRHKCRNAPKHLKTLKVGVTLMNLLESGDGPHFTVINKSLDTLLKEECSPVVPRGPFKCIYCPTVTKREREMKTHIWKYCRKSPKFIKKKCKEGVSLEDLGFVCQRFEVEDAIHIKEPSSSETLDTVQEPSSSKIQDIVQEPSSSKTQDIDVQDTDDNYSNFSSHIADDDDAFDELPSLMHSQSMGNRSKEPLVCAYCGIWYYREISLIKHMKERCIIIPAHDKFLLNQGSGLCDTGNASVNPKVLNSAKGCYRRVLGTNLQESFKNFDKIPPDNPEVNVPIVFNEDLKYLRSPSKSTISGEVTSLTNENDQVVTSKTEPIQAKRNAKPQSTRCNRCHESFISEEAVLAHSSVHHGPKKGLYKCKLCHERFQRYKQLREHVWTHTEETPYKCHVCYQKFRLSDLLLTHLVTLHNYTGAHEKNLFKWLPGRDGKYRVIENSNDAKYEGEGTLLGMDASLENLAEDMVVTDEIWSVKDEGMSCGSDKSSIDINTKKKIKDEPEKLGKSTGFSESDKLDVPSQGEKSDCHQKTSPNDKSRKTSPNDKSRVTNDLKRDDKEMAKKSEESTNLKINHLNQFKLRHSPVKRNPDIKGGSDEDEDDGELFSGMGNLDSIIETVNLTDDSFLG